MIFKEVGSPCAAMGAMPQYYDYLKQGQPGQ